MNCNRILNFTESDFPTIVNERKKKNVTDVDVVVDSISGATDDSLCTNGTDCDDAAVAGTNANCPLSTFRNASVSQQKQGNCDQMKTSIDTPILVQELWQKRRQRQYRKSSSRIFIRDFLIPKEFADMVREKRFKDEAIRDEHRGKIVGIVNGNPLDSDKPTRFKGIANIPKKPKRITAIKRRVYRYRNDYRPQLDYDRFDASTGNDVDNNRIECECEHDCSHSTYFNCQLKNSTNNRIDASEYLVINRTQNETRSYSRERKYDDVATTTEDTRVSPVAAAQIHQTVPVPVPPYLLSIHHHNFKSYCDNCITGELNRAAEELVGQIFRFQRCKYQTNPIRAVSNKRYVIGLKQVRKYLVSNKIELLLLVPDMEDSLRETVEELKTLAFAYSIPYLFAFSRRKLGYLMGKRNGVASFGLLNSMGAEDNLKKTLEAAHAAKKFYREKCEEAQNYCDNHLHCPIEKIHNQEKNVLDKNDVDNDVAVYFTEVLSLKSEIDRD